MKQQGQKRKIRAARLPQKLKIAQIQSAKLLEKAEAQSVETRQYRRQKLTILTNMEEIEQQKLALLQRAEERAIATENLQKEKLIALQGILRELSSFKTK